MPLVEYSLEILRDTLLELKKGKVLTLSHPDIITSPDTVKRIFSLSKEPKLREDAVGIINWHKAHNITDSIVDTEWLFEQLGFTMTALDIVEGRGKELLHDLNEPLSHYFHEAFDLVYDCISNQVFNVAQCMANAALACKVNGYVFHTIPVLMVNQGFWNVSPTAYHDFYRANGFNIRLCKAVRGVYANLGEVDLHSYQRCRGVPDDTMNVILAQKVASNRVIQWPTMKKFTIHPKCLISYPAFSVKGHPYE